VDDLAADPLLISKVVRVTGTEGRRHQLRWVLRHHPDDRRLLDEFVVLLPVIASASGALAAKTTIAVVRRTSQTVR
jgi:hypothetical protein